MFWEKNVKLIASEKFEKRLLYLKPWTVSHEKGTMRKHERGFGNLNIIDKVQKSLSGLKH